ncbi:MAG: type I restriction endonuclease subunit R [Leptolyngbyaceae cyanobacterium MAG.088]|nr:type I restriction endonuclease subunit R [Leptolyngbyaceae cyanobacterium MAG.088]
MTAALGVTDRIKTLNDLQSRFNLQQASSDTFFNEWLTDLPDLSSAQVLGVERLKTRYDYHRAEGLLLEGTINTVVLAPLMELAGFLDPPFRLKSPYGISLELDDPDEVIRGFIDTLVVQEQLWIMVVEPKRTSIPVPAALPQLLAYVLASPQPEQPVYGMATNGDEFVFLKVLQPDGLLYDTSRTFSLFPRRHELGEILKILTHLGRIVSDSSGIVSR